MGGVGGAGGVGGVLQQLRALTKGKIQELEGRGVVNIAHSMAKLHARGGKGYDAQLVGELQARAKVVVGGFIPQQVSMLLWALATMGVKNPDPGLLKEMKGRARETAGDFKPQEIANVMWALAKMRNRPDAGLLLTDWKQCRCVVQMKCCSAQEWIRFSTGGVCDSNELHDLLLLSSLFLLSLELRDAKVCEP